MLDISMYLEIDNETMHAPFAEYSDIRASLIRMGALKVNGAPCEEVISQAARTFTVLFTESYMYGFDTDDSDLFFIYESLCGLWDKKDIYGMYFYAVLCSAAGLRYVPKELTRFACREDLLNLFMKHFIYEYGKLVCNSGNNANKNE